MVPFPQPRYLPCTNCGASVVRAEAESHVCEPQRQLDFTVIQLSGELAQFDHQLTAYLATPRGRFEAWYAASRR
jgi:hypothetical protein